MVVSSHLQQFADTCYAPISSRPGLIVLELFLIILCYVFSFAEVYLRLLIGRLGWYPHKITSDIPGNPHCFDWSIISLFRTLPEPSNFNLIWTNLPVDEPFILRGKFPSYKYRL